MNMTAYKDIKKYTIDGNLVRFKSEVGEIVDGVKIPNAIKHVDTFIQGQETELEAFCTLHDATETYNIIITAWGV